MSKFYTAPTAIRSLMKFGKEQVEGHDLSCLKVLGTVGEPINPEAWLWYHKVEEYLYYILSFIWMDFEGGWRQPVQHLGHVLAD